MKGEDEPVRLTVRSTHHGPLVNEVLGADEEVPLAFRWTALDEPGLGHAEFRLLEPRSGPELVEMLRDVTMPVVNLIWAEKP